MRGPRPRPGPRRDGQLVRALLANGPRPAAGQRAVGSSPRSRASQKALGVSPRGFALIIRRRSDGGLQWPPDGLAKSRARRPVTARSSAWLGRRGRGRASFVPCAHGRPAMAVPRGSQAAQRRSARRPATQAIGQTVAAAARRAGVEAGPAGDRGRPRRPRPTSTIRPPSSRAAPGRGWPAARPAPASATSASAISHGWASAPVLRGAQVGQPGRGGDLHRPDPGRGVERQARAGQAGAASAVAGSGGLIGRRAASRPRRSRPGPRRPCCGSPAPRRPGRSRRRCRRRRPT